MREMELGLQVQLNGDIFLAILRLPPRLLARARQIFVDNLADAMVTQRIVDGVLVCLAQKAFLLLQMGNDAEAIRLVLGAARRRGQQTLLAADEQIAGGRITGALLARMHLDSFQWPLGCIQVAWEKVEKMIK